MLKYLKTRKAFSMLELIFVIIILGIVSSIGAEIIANVYEQYIIQRAQHRASVKTELVATQIANRLSYAIPDTVVRRSALNGAFEDINVATAIDHNILQWVAADADSFNAISVAGGAPGWSGFCDLDISPVTGTTVSTPGSNLNLAQNIINHLGGNIVNASLYYVTGNALRNIGINAVAGNTITTDAPLGSMSEQYKLAWTSYAVEANANGDLWLYYNFAPTRGVNIPNQTRELLLRNVTTFEFRGDGQTVRFKICIDEDIGLATMVTICKEKAVF